MSKTTVKPGELDGFNDSDMDGTINSLDKTRIIGYLNELIPLVNGQQWDDLDNASKTKAILCIKLIFADIVSQLLKKEKLIDDKPDVLGNISSGLTNFIENPSQLDKYFDSLKINKANAMMILEDGNLEIIGGNNLESALSNMETIDTSIEEYFRNGDGRGNISNIVSKLTSSPEKDRDTLKQILEDDFKNLFTKLSNNNIINSAGSIDPYWNTKGIDYDSIRRKLF